MYKLTRIKPNDGAGISGGWACTVARVVDGELEKETEATRPKEGWLLLVESPSRWWRTTIVDRILTEEENDERVKITFTTLNSTYEFRRLK